MTKHPALGDGWWMMHHLEGNISGLLKYTGTYHISFINWFQESNMMPIHLSYNSSHLPLSFTWSQVRVFRKLLNQSKLQIVIKLPITGLETSPFNTQSFKNRLCQYRTRLDMKTFEHLLQRGLMFLKLLLW